MSDTLQDEPTSFGDVPNDAFLPLVRSAYATLHIEFITLGESIPCDFRSTLLSNGCATLQRSSWFCVFTGSRTTARGKRQR